MENVRAFIALDSFQTLLGMERKTKHSVGHWRGMWHQCMKERSHWSVTSVAIAVLKRRIWTAMQHQFMEKRSHSNVTFVTTAWGKMTALGGGGQWLLKFYSVFVMLHWHKRSAWMNTIKHFSVKVVHPAFHIFPH